MSSCSEGAFYSFLDDLPYKYSKFYMLMDAYKSHLSLEHSSDIRAKYPVSGLFKDAIMKIVSDDMEPRNIVERKQMGITEDSDKTFDEEFGEWIPKKKRKGIIDEVDKKFDKELGEWASSFSSSEEEIEQNAAIISSVPNNILHEMTKGDIIPEC